MRAANSVSAPGASAIGDSLQSDTASGLVVVFGNSGDLGESADHAKIASGIARALGTTIAGLVVAVPSVVAHSYFNRKIETMAARLEVLLGRVVSACHQHVFYKQK